MDSSALPRPRSAQSLMDCSLFCFPVSIRMGAITVKLPARTMIGVRIDAPRALLPLLWAWITNRNFDALWDFRRHFAWRFSGQLVGQPIKEHLRRPRRRFGTGNAQCCVAPGSILAYSLVRGRAYRKGPAIFFTWGFDINQTGKIPI